MFFPATSANRRFHVVSLTLEVRLTQAKPYCAVSVSARSVRSFWIAVSGTPNDLAVSLNDDSSSSDMRAKSPGCPTSCLCTSNPRIWAANVRHLMAVAPSGLVVLPVGLPSLSLIGLPCNEISARYFSRLTIHASSIPASFVAISRDFR